MTNKMWQYEVTQGGEWMENGIMVTGKKVKFYGHWIEEQNGALVIHKYSFREDGGVDMHRHPVAIFAAGNWVRVERKER